MVVRISKLILRCLKRFNMTFYCENTTMHCNIWRQADIVTLSWPAQMPQ